MRSISIALLLTAAGCHDCPPPPDDGVDDGSSSSAGESSESDSQSVEDDCKQEFRECTCAPGYDRPDLCIEPYFECSPEATAEHEACLDAKSQCEAGCPLCQSGAPDAFDCQYTRNLCLSMCYDDCVPEYPACSGSCEDIFIACWDSDADFDMCLDAYFACDPDAEEAYAVCTGQVSTCIWNCCPYEEGAPGWNNACGPNSGAENFDAVNACIDDCGLFADCLP